MLFIIGFPFIALVATYIWFEAFCDYYLIHDLFSYFVFGKIGFILGFTIAITVGENTSQPTRSYTVPIQSVKSSDQISGRFFLGTGTIGKKRYYTYWTSEGTRVDGAVQRKTITSADIVEIVEGTSNPRVEITEKVRKLGLWAAWTDSRKMATFYIPEGSVQYNYNIE